MKRLYIIRHAKSSWDQPQLSDFDRPLNKRGQKAAPFMGQRLKKYKVYPDLIISSSAERAKTTAELIAQEINYTVNEIRYIPSLYEAGYNDLLDILSQIEDKYQNIFIIGHNPTMTEAANQLSNYQVPDLPTSAIFCIDFDIQSWIEIQDSLGNFVFFDYPKKHKE